MKKKGLALLLAVCMSVGSLGNITSHALEIQTETQTEGTSNEVQESTDLEITNEVPEGTVEEETTESPQTEDSVAETEQIESETEPAEKEPVEDAEADVESNDSAEAVEVTEETAEPEREERAMAETTGDFHGEIETDETSVSVVDENGNITYVDMSKDDTIVEETAMFRAATPQIVNFRYKGGVIEYTEPATGTAGYTAGSYGADAAYLGRNGNKVKFMLAGVIGEVPAGNVQVLSKSSAKSVSHYYISNGRLLHSIATNVNSSNYGSTLDNGPAPSYLKSGVKYYSYDGHYFYTEENFGNMLDDYNLETRAHSVNPNNPYYNYFQYLPFRSQSNYSGSSLNTALNNRVTSTSKMKNTGNDFVNHQNTYGANALLMIGIGANESGWGTSSIARNKNNIFGLNAVDSSPGQSANYFASVSQCIKEFAEKWLSKEYLNPANWKHYGSFLGNKASGMNVKYASDPYWGEKAAAMAWLLDRTNGNKDAFKYTIGIKDMIRPANSVNVRKDGSTSSTKIYTTKKNSGLAFLILNNTPTNGFYKIQSEPVLNSGRTAINSKSGVYDFKNMYAYISSDYVKVVNKGNGSSSWAVNGITTNVSSPRPMNTEIKISANVSGDTAGLQYKFVWEKDNWKEWGVIKDFSSTSTVNWRPTKSGTYNIYMDVREGAGDSVTVTLPYRILDWSYTGISTNLSSPQVIGKQISVSANVGGATKGLQYKFVWEKDNWKEWGVIQNISTKNSAIWKPAKAGTYNLHVDVRDSQGYTISLVKPFKISEVSWEPTTLAVSSKLEVGKEVKLTQNIKSNADGTLPLQYKFVWEKNNWEEWGVIRDFSSSNSVSWKPQVSGKCNIHVNVEDRSGKVLTKVSSINIAKGSWKYLDISADKKSPQFAGEKIQLKVNLQGNAAGVKYKFVWEKDNWKEWGVIQGMSLKNSTIWIPQKEGTYKLIVDIEDTDGKATSHDITYKIEKPVFESIQISPKTGNNIGGKIQIKANCKGVVANAKYKFVWMKDNWKEWGILRDFSTSSGINWAPKLTGNYTIFVDVQFGNGLVQTKSVNISVGKWSYDGVNITKGSSNSYNVQPVIKGNTAGFTYKYVWQKDNWKEWGIIKDFSTSDSAKWIPKKKGKYVICVDVKDANGNVTTKQKTYTVQ